MATKKKSNRRLPVHLQVGRARHTDETIVLRCSKTTARKMLKMADGRGVLNVNEEDLVSAIETHGYPQVESRGLSHEAAENLVSAIQIDPPFNSQESILEEANRIIYGDREQAYGSPRFNLDTIAQFWSVYLKRKFPEHQNPFINDMDISAEDVAQLMILLKTARLIHNPTHRDSLVDQAGYAALQNRIQGDKS